MHADKRALRARVIALRDAIDPAQRARDSRAIAEAIGAMPELRDAKVLLLTLPFGSEWDTRPLVDRALAEGRVVALPRADAAARMLALHAIGDPDADVTAGRFGVPEPRADCPAVSPADVDAAIVPGVAFDGRGGRIGYGGGYYDRLLPLIRPGVPLVAGAFDVQVVAHVPRAPHDVAVHCIVTPTRVLRA